MPILRTGIPFKFIARCQDCAGKMSLLARESWGPHFWFILHTLAECVGEQTNIVLERDEEVAWQLLLKTQRFVMPCDLCRRHFHDWISTHSLGVMSTLHGESRKGWLRKWLWGCHDKVNIEAQKQSPALDTLSSLYPRASLEPALGCLNQMFQKALELQKLKPDEISKWRQLVSRLRTLYGF